MRSVVIALLLLCGINTSFAQGIDADQLFTKLRNKMDAVKDYEANVTMKIDITFIKVPKLKGKLFFKAPDRLKLERNGGIAILPRNGVNLTVTNLVPKAGATVIDAGKEMVNGKNLRILKVIPNSEQDAIILTKIWVDEPRLLIMRTETTTRDNGTVKMDLQFGKYEAIGLPDRVQFFMDVKDFKLPKGLTMDYETGAQPTPQQQTADAGKRKKGRIEINYLDYIVNKGMSDKVFEDRKK